MLALMEFQNLCSFSMSIAHFNQPILIYSKSTMETSEQCVKYAQS